MLRCVQLNDGGYAIAGTGIANTSTTPVSTIALLRVDSSGQTTWIKTFNAKQNSTVTSGDTASAMILTNEGSYAIAGSTTVMSEYHQDVVIVKTESLEEPPKSTPTANPSESESQNPDITPSQSSNSIAPEDTDFPNNSQTHNPNMVDTFNPTIMWTGLLVGTIVVGVIVSIVILYFKKSKIQKGTPYP